MLVAGCVGMARRTEPENTVRGPQELMARTNREARMLEEMLLQRELIRRLEAKIRVLEKELQEVKNK